MLLHSISGVLIILIMILVGYILTNLGWFDENFSKTTSKIVTQIALPCYMLYTITKQFSKAELIKMFPDLRFPIASMVLLFVISWFMQKLFHIDEQHRGLFKSMFSNSNTVFVGLPVNMALFGSASLPYALIYYMANTTFFWTLGVYLIRTDGEHDDKFGFMEIIKKVFSPPLLGFMLGVVLVLLDIKVPDFLMSDFNYLGSLTVPLSMLFIGMKLAQVGLQNIRWSKDMGGIFLGRFVLAPLLMLALLYWTSAPTLMKQVFILQAAMPVMTNAPVVAKLYGADSDYAAVMVTATTVFSLVMVPILMSAITVIF